MLGYLQNVDEHKYGGAIEMAKEWWKEEKKILSRGVDAKNYVSIRFWYKVWKLISRISGNLGKLVSIV